MLSDEAYKEFNDRILNAPSMPTLGIRIPKLRELAKEAAKEPEGGWLDEMLRDHGSCLSGRAHALWDGFRIQKSIQRRTCGHARYLVPGVLVRGL